MKPLKQVFSDALDTLLQKMALTYGWEYGTPTPSYPDLFEDPTESTFHTWFRRVPWARFIVEGIASDSWDKGFRVEPFDHDASELLYATFKDIFIPQIVRAHALSRLDGYSILLLGFNDKKMPEWDQPVDWNNAKLKWTLAVPKQGLMITEWILTESSFGKTIYGPLAHQPKDMRISNFAELPQIHPDRYIYMEYPDITDLSAHGVSVLEPVADMCYASRNMVWSAAQAAWRAAVGMLTLIHPKGLKEDQKQKVLANWGNINSRHVGAIPDDWKIQIDGLGKSTIPISKNYEILLKQVSVASRTPISVLEGAPRGAFGGAAKNSDLQDYYQTISTIQNEFCSPWTVRALKILDKTGQITLPKDKWWVEWYPLFKLGFKEKAADIAAEQLSDELVDIFKTASHDEKLELLRLFLSTGGLS